MQFWNFLISKGKRNELKQWINYSLYFVVNIFVVILQKEIKTNSALLWKSIRYREAWLVGTTEFGYM